MVLKPMKPTRWFVDSWAALPPGRTRRFHRTCLRHHGAGAGSPAHLPDPHEAPQRMATW